MTRIMAVAIVIAALSAQLSSGRQVAPSGVDVYFDAESQLVVGEPLIVRSTIRQSAESVDIDLGWNRKGAVRLRLRNPTAMKRAVLEKMFMSDHDERYRVASDALVRFRQKGQ